MLDFGSGSRGLNKCQPFPLRGLRRRLQNVNRIAAIELVSQGNNFPIDLCANTMIADFRMNGIGQIQRGGAKRQLLDLTFWGKGKHHIMKNIQMKQVEFHGIHELLVV